MARRGERRNEPKREEKPARPWTRTICRALAHFRIIFRTNGHRMGSSRYMLTIHSCKIASYSPDMTPGLGARFTNDRRDTTRQRMHGSIPIRHLLSTCDGNTAQLRDRTLSQWTAKAIETTALVWSAQRHGA